MRDRAIKPPRLRKSGEEPRAMGAYVSLFGTLEDAHAFERAALAVAAPFLPPCARVVRDGGTPTELYWRWLAIQAEVWS